MQRAKVIATLIVFLFVGRNTISQTKTRDGEPFDTYSQRISWKRETKFLDNFSIYLKRFPNTTGYILYFVGDKDDTKSARARANRAKNYLFAQNVRANRIVVLCGGKLDNSRTSLYLVEPAAPLPKAGKCH